LFSAAFKNVPSPPIIFYYNLIFDYNAQYKKTKKHDSSPLFSAAIQEGAKKISRKKREGHKNSQTKRKKNNLTRKPS
jgi:hypothetical protein